MSFKTFSEANEWGRNQGCGIVSPSEEGAGFEWVCFDEEESAPWAIDLERLSTFVRYSFDGMTILCKELFLAQLSKWRTVSDDRDKVIERSDQTLAWRDTDTSLVWDVALIFQDIHGTMPTSVHYAQNDCQYAGFADWRQPTVYELSTLLTEERNERELFIKKPLLNSHPHRSWGASRYVSDDSLFFDYQQKRAIQQQYHEPDCGRGQYEFSGVASRSVRGEITISRQPWVNAVARWAARNNNVGFPVRESDIVALRELELFPNTELEVDELPIEFLRFQDVKAVKIGGDFRVIPNLIYQFENLQSLHLSNSYKIDRVDNEIGKLKNLENLTVRARGVRSLPESVVELQGLKVLSLPLSTQCGLTARQESWVQMLRERGCKVKQSYV